MVNVVMVAHWACVMYTDRNCKETRRILLSWSWRIRLEIAIFVSTWILQLAPVWWVEISEIVGNFIFEMIDSSDADTEFLQSVSTCQISQCSFSYRLEYLGFHARDLILCHTQDIWALISADAVNYLELQPTPTKSFNTNLCAIKLWLNPQHFVYPNCLRTLWSFCHSPKSRAGWRSSKTYKCSSRTMTTQLFGLITYNLRVHSLRWHFRLMQIKV